MSLFRHKEDSEGTHSRLRFSCMSSSPLKCGVSSPLIPNRLRPTPSPLVHVPRFLFFVSVHTRRRTYVFTRLRPTSGKFVVPEGPESVSAREDPETWARTRRLDSVKRTVENVRKGRREGPSIDRLRRKTSRRNFTLLRGVDP